MEQLDAVEWRMKAMAVLYRVTAAERRFTASMRVNEITVLAASDELEAAIRDAGVWLEQIRVPTSVGRTFAGHAGHVPGSRHARRSGRSSVTPATRRRSWAGSTSCSP